MLEIEVNGEARTVAEDTTIADLVEDRLGERSPQGVAVARNREVVRRGEWEECRVETGDEVEILAAFEGG